MPSFTSCNSANSIFEALKLVLSMLAILIPAILFFWKWNKDILKEKESKRNKILAVKLIVSGWISAEFLRIKQQQLFLDKAITDCQMPTTGIFPELQIEIFSIGKLNELNIIDISDYFISNTTTQNFDNLAKVEIIRNFFSSVELLDNYNHMLNEDFMKFTSHVKDSSNQQLDESKKFGIKINHMIALKQFSHEQLTEIERIQKQGISGQFSQQVAVFKQYDKLIDAIAEKGNDLSEVKGDCQAVIKNISNILGFYKQFNDVLIGRKTSLEQITEELNGMHFLLENSSVNEIKDITL